MKISWLEFKNYLDSLGISPQYIESDSYYTLFCKVGSQTLSTKLDKTPTDTTDLDSFINNYKSKSNKSESNLSLPFGSKILPNGKSLFRRMVGITASLTDAQTIIEFTVPFPACKILGLQILNGKIGDTVNFKILDTDTGTVTGYPNYQLNQFGFDVNILPEVATYPSKYDADLFQGLVLRLEYSSVVESPNRTIYINFDLHEVKA